MNKVAKAFVASIAVVPRLVSAILGTICYTQAQTASSLPAPLKEALYYASLSPSSHNAQMWTLYYSPSNYLLTLVLDKARTLDKVDPQYREAYISLGAYAQTMEEALGAYGYALSCT